MSVRIDVRLTLAAFDAAITLRQPPPCCLHHGDRLHEAKLVGSVGRRGNPHDNAMMERLMRTLMVKDVCPVGLEIAEELPAFIEKCKN